MRIQRGGGGQGIRHTPLKNHKSIAFLSNNHLDPLKYHKATKVAIIGTPAKCHLNVVSAEGADDGL